AAFALFPGGQPFAAEFAARAPVGVRRDLEAGNAIGAEQAVVLTQAAPSSDDLFLLVVRELNGPDGALRRLARRVLVAEVDGALVTHGLARAFEHGRARTVAGEVDRPEARVLDAGTQVLAG